MVEGWCVRTSVGSNKRGVPVTCPAKETDVSRKELRNVLIEEHKEVKDRVYNGITPSGGTEGRGRQTE